MIVSVTTLGSRSGNAAGAVAAVVKYLEGSSRTERAGRDPAPSPELPGVEPTDGVLAYYADSGAAPGIWMGQGVGGVRLSGLADSEQLQRVLLGQNPHTGEQLLAPTGSAQRAHPNAVRAALRGPDDELLGLGEAAEALGVEASYLRRQVLATHKVRALHAQQAAAGQELTPLPPSHLDATRDRPGAPWKVARGELRRFAAERAKPGVVVGYDLTFSVAKSVSILWATATPSQRVAIEAAFTDAVRSGLRYLEEQAAHVRVSVGNDSGKGTHLERRAATGLVAAAYLHDTGLSIPSSISMSWWPTWPRAPTARSVPSTAARSTCTPRRRVTWLGRSCATA